MILPAVPVLTFKFLFWALALAVFLRYLSDAWRPTPAVARHYGAAMLLGIVIGAKLVYALTYPAVGLNALAGDTRALLTLAGAGSAPGALLGAALALLWARRRGARVSGAKQMPQAAVSDAMPATETSVPFFDLDWLVVPAALALAILDCGSTFWALSEPGFGIFTTASWGMDFGDGIPRHPVMLYEATFLVAAAWVHGRLDSRVFQSGERALLFIAAYCGLRILLDYLRPPFGPPFITEMMHPYPWIYLRVMTGEQWVCLLALLCLIPGWYLLSRRLLTTRE